MSSCFRHWETFQMVERPNLKGEREEMGNNLGQLSRVSKKSLPSTLHVYFLLIVEHLLGHF